MNVYIYNADIYCDDCGKAIIEELLKDDPPKMTCQRCHHRWRAKTLPDSNHADWYECQECGDYAASFDDMDSDDFPQSAPDSGGESDSVQHCGSGENCLNAISLSPDQWGRVHKIGMWLENDLTSEGVAALCEEVKSGAWETNEVIGLHKQWYADDLYNCESSGDVCPNCEAPDVNDEVCEGCGYNYETGEIER